jgi:hypothetical protein
MGIMNDEKRLDAVLERFYQRFNRYNTKVLKTLGEAIKQFDGLTPSQAHKLVQELKYSTEIDQLLNELSQLSGKSAQELDILLDKVAEENVAFAETYYKVKGKEFIPYEDNIQLKRYVETIKKDTKGTFKDLTKSKNIGFTFRDGDKIIYKPLKKTFTDLLDEAVFNVSTGVSDYQSAMRNTMNSLADSGIKIHEEKLGYKNGYNKRIDSSIRQAVLEGIRKINIDVQEQIGKEIGADGVEISHHENCAIDHYIIDGQQFTNKKFEEINSNLDRPVGTYNCKHFVFSIVLGVDNPQFTKKQLEEDRKRNEKGFEYNNKHYTNYEGTQLMRKVETEIRKQKDRQIIGRSAGNKEIVQKAQSKINKLTIEYNKISKISGLPTYKQRLSVSGYRKINANKMK